MAQFIRPLFSREQVERFVQDVLGIRPSMPDFETTVSNVFRLELQLKEVETKSTLVSLDNRHRSYRNKEDRESLRKTILDELFTLDRLENDDDIVLGRGGAMPLSGVKKQRIAYYVIGLPASGKSGIVNEISEKYGAVVIDADYAKRKFPEYNDDFGPAITHEESSSVIFGGREVNDSLLSRCVAAGMNIVIPKIGSELQKVIDFIKILRDNNYTVHLILVRLNRVLATRRAYQRCLKTHRYVALPLIFDGYGNEPTIVYYDLKRCHRNLCESFTMLSTDVAFGEPAEVLDYTKRSPYKQ